jgi:ABC-type lipoprotein release transport system permease subunit
VATLAFLAWRNLWRNPVRSGLTAGAMVAGLALMIVVAALTEGVLRKFVSAATELNLGQLQIHRRAFVDDQDLFAVLPPGLIAHLARETGFALSPRAYAAALASSSERSTGVLLKGIDPEREGRVTTLHRHVWEGAFELGRWREPGRALAEMDIPVYTVVIGTQLARALGVEVGDELVLITQAADGSIGNGLFRVGGVLGPVEPAFDRMGVLLSLEAYQSLMFLEEGVHEVAVSAGAAQQFGEAQRALQAAVATWPGELPDGQSGPVVVRRWDEINPGLSEMIGFSDTYMVIMIFLIFGLVALSMVNTVLMSIHERTREFGILLAMGMGRARLLGMVLLESVFLALLSAVVGGVLGVLWALHLEEDGIDFSYFLPEGFDWAGVTIEPSYGTYLLPGQVVTSVVVMLVTVLLAALIPAWRTVRLKPAEAMHG